jgi:hypothetical protein
MGLLEYLEIAEEVAAQPILAVFAGYTLNGSVIAQSQLAPYVQDALDEIQYAIGPTTSTYGAMRGADGHPAPFKLNYVEVGNEDFFDTSGSYNSYRFPMFYDAIKAAYPQLKIIATTNVTSRTPDVIDDHYYSNDPSVIAGDAHTYDSSSRSGPKHIASAPRGSGCRVRKDSARVRQSLRCRGHPVRRTRASVQLISGCWARPVWDR